MRPSGHIPPSPAALPLPLPLRPAWWRCGGEYPAGGGPRFLHWASGRRPEPCQPTRVSSGQPRTSVPTREGGQRETALLSLPLPNLNHSTITRVLTRNLSVKYI